MTFVGVRILLVLLVADEVALDQSRMLDDGRIL
jgi:hypothetical protein